MRIQLVTGVVDDLTPARTRPRDAFIQVMTAVTAVAVLIWLLWLGGRIYAGVPIGRSRGLVVPVMVAFAVLIATATGPWRRFGAWCALALAGQAVALGMIDAGPLIHYQHYRPLADVGTAGGRLLIAALIGQAVVVTIGIAGYWRALWACLRSVVGTIPFIAACVGAALTSAAVSRDAPGYVSEVLFAVLVQAVNALNIVLMVTAVPAEALGKVARAIDRVLGPARQPEVGSPTARDSVALYAAAATALLAALLSRLVYDAHPHIPDEVLYVFQARYFATGHLTVTPPTVVEAFSFYLIPWAAPRWYSPFPPGWPAVLAAGVVVGVPWLINPLLTGLNVLLAFVLVGQFWGRSTARLTAILLAASPWHLFVGMSLMAHPLSLTCALCAALSLLTAHRTGRLRWAFAGGTALSGGVLVRPLDGVIVAVILAVAALRFGRGRVRVMGVAALLAGMAIVGALGLEYNKALTGSFVRMPLEAYYDEYFGEGVNALGFGANRGFGWALDPFPGHGVRDAVVNGSLNAFSLNIELLGWSVGSLALLFVLLASGRMGVREWAMLAVVAAVVAAYSLYWYSGGPDFGARYWFLAIVPLIALSARGVEFLAAVIEHWTGAGGATRLRFAVFVLTATALLGYLPWRITDKYHHYLLMRSDVRRLAEEREFGRSLVLVRGDWHPDYASAWTYNPLDPNADGPMYAWDRSPDVRRRVVAAYPDRPVWVVDGPTRTGDGFRVVAGPFAPGMPALE